MTDTVQIPMGITVEQAFNVPLPTLRPVFGNCIYNRYKQSMTT